MSITRSLFLGVACALLGGCGSEGAPGSQELESKQEYSVLQSYEYNYRDRGNSDGVVVEELALGSKFHVVGLPKRGEPKGYIWFIANSDDPKAIQRLPKDGEVEIDLETLGEIQRSQGITRALREHLASRVSPGG